MAKDFEFVDLGKLGKSISMQEMKGNDNVYFRLTKLYRDDEGNWHPTKQGVSVPVAECVALRNALDSFIKAHGVSDGKIGGETDLVSDLSALG